MENLSNGAQSTLNGAINNSVTSLVVTSASGFPAANFRILVDTEIMLVTAVSTNTFTVTRGVESTTAASHSNSATVTQILTLAGLLQYLKDNLNLPFVFSGSGTPVIATDVCPWQYVHNNMTVTRMTLTAKTSPTGNFQVTIKRSTDNGSTFPDIIATVTVGSGSKIATTTTITNSVLAPADVLRCDIISVNAAADWVAKLN